MPYNPETETFEILVPVTFTAKDFDLPPATFNAFKKKLADVARDEIYAQINKDAREFLMRNK